MGALKESGLLFFCAPKSACYFGEWVSDAMAEWVGIPASLCWMVCCWSFTSRQHLKSYEDGYRLVTVCIHGDLIVLLHREIRLSAS